MAETEELALYIHYPWCIQRCPYCDFNAHGITGIEGRNKSTQDLSAEWAHALRTNLQSDLPIVEQKALTSLYIGGGTPSLIHPHDLESVLEAVKQWQPIDGIEVTMECNPGSIEHFDLQSYADIGINRLSLGVQSLDALQLHNLGRIHNAEQALTIIEKSLATFDRVNVDLMYGLPQQSAEEAVQDIEQVLSLGVRHLSWYQLTIEPSTPFYTQNLVLPTEEVLLETEEQARSVINRYGLHQYEVSAWSSDKHQCRHNLNYWRFGDYLGIGPGAHSKIGVQRWACLKQPRSWLEHPSKKVLTRTLSEHDLKLEFLMNALRLSEGFYFADYECATGLTFAGSELASTIDYLAEQGVMVVDESSCVLSSRGQKILDLVLTALVPT